MNIQLRIASHLVVAGLISLLLFDAFPLGRADQVDLENGDRLSGKVVGITETNVTLRSSINGLMQLPRNKVTVITLGEGAPKPSTVPAPQIVTSPKPTAKAAASLPKAGDVDRKSIKQVQEQLLGNASPEATSKFNEMVKSLLTGSLSVEDIRNQARSSVKDLEEAKKDLGEDFGSVLDGYLNVLQGFLNESDNSASTKSSPKPVPSPHAKIPAADE